MYEYRSLRSSTYDVDSLVDRLNGADSDGWEVVTVVNAGGDLVAIVRRSNAPAAIAADVTAEAPQTAAVITTESPAAAETESPTATAEVAPVIEPEPEPAPVAAAEPEPAPVEEPAGWAAAVETPSVIAPSAAETVHIEPEPMVVSRESDMQPAAVATVTEAQPAPQAAPQPEPQPVVTTPAGWYPDPSGRYELRYWNGTAWTEHVARGGQQYTDPPVA